MTQVRNALLVNPKFPTSFWGFQHAMQFYGNRTAFPPLSLMTVSGFLPKPWNQTLVDENVRDVMDEDIAQADLVMVTAMLPQEENMRRVIARAKAMGKKVALGGPFISTLAGEEPPADYIFKGEAEATLPQFLKDLEMGIPEKYYEVDEKNRPELSLTPPANFSLINLKNYGCMSVQYSRGCPFNCEFCDIIEIYGRKPRTKENAQLLADFDALYDLGWRGPLFIVDDNFIGNKKNLRLLMPELIEWQRQRDFPFALFTEASVNLAEDLELLDNMRAAGFNRVFLGIETPDEESLKAAQKKQNTAHGDLVGAVHTIRNRGNMEVMAGFIVGFDNEPENIYDRMIEFIRQAKIPHAMVGMLQAPPHTQLWRRLQKEGRLFQGHEGNGGNIYDRPNFATTMDPDSLVAGLKRVHRTIYDSRNYYNRVLDHFDGLPEESGFFNTETQTLKENITSLCRLIKEIGIKEKDRWEFWRFLGKTAIKHPDMMVTALGYSAYGYHFRKLLPQ